MNLQNTTTRRGTTNGVWAVSDPEESGVVNETNSSFDMYLITSAELPTVV